MKEGRRLATQGFDQVDDESGYDVFHYNIEIRFDPTDETVTGHADMDLTATADILTQVEMHFCTEMTIDAVQVDGVTTNYTHTGDWDLVVDLLLPLTPGGGATINIDFHGHPTPMGAMGGIYWQYHGDTPVISSLYPNLKALAPGGPARTFLPTKPPPARSGPFRTG
jgi:aminopeptidase N